MATPADLLRSYLDAGDSGDLDTVARLIHADVVTHSPGAVTLHGAEPQLAAWRAALDGMTDLRHELLEVVVDGSRVAGRVRVTGRHTGPFLGLAPTGRAIDVSQGLFARIEEGLLVELWEVVDTGLALRQLGVLGDQSLSPGTA